MGVLQASRPVFHTEADFQHAFAWECHTRHPEARVRLERRLSSEVNERLDLLLMLENVTIAIELKYPQAKLTASVDGEQFVMREHSAIDVMRFSYVWDIVRLEGLVAAGVADVGVAVLLTNVPGLWDVGRPSKKLAADTEFRLHEGRELAGRLGWSGDATWWKGKLPESVALTGSYPVAWSPYSTVTGEGRGEFRWTMALVAGDRALESWQPDL